MNKSDMINAMAKAGDISKVQAEKVLEGITDSIKESLTKGERVALPGIGNLSCVQRKARTGRNPRTGQEIKIPEKKNVKFSLVGSLKALLNPFKEQ